MILILAAQIVTEFHIYQSEDFKFMKTFTQHATLVAILSALSAPAMSADMPTLYGKAHVSFGTVSEDSGTDTSSTAITSHASRVGVKGSIDTESGTQVIYNFEWEIDIADTSKDSTSVTGTDTDTSGDFDEVTAKSSNHLKARKQFVGLKADWGQIRVGRDDSPYKVAGKKNVEHLSDTWADFNNIIDKGQDTRNDDSISYRNKMGPGKLMIAYAAGDDDAAAENAGESTSIAYDMKMGNIGFAIAQQTIETSTTNDETGLKLSFGYKMGATQLGLMYENVEDDGTMDDKNTYFSVKHKLSDTNSVVFAYGTKDQGLTDDATMTAVAFNHKLGKKVSVYALWADGSDNGLNAASKLAGDGSAMVAGLVAKF